MRLPFLSAIFLTSFLLPLSSHAATSPLWAKGLTLDSVMELLDRKQISSMEELLPELPRELRSQFVLVRKSRSLQGATPQMPRTILYAENAQFIAAFNGDESLPGHDELEMIQFNTVEKSFEFYGLPFPIRRDISGHAIRPEKNPPRCLLCHGQSPHPIWNAYNEWPGVYGEHDDFLFGAELEDFKGFLATKDTSPRYRHLAPMAGSVLSPFSYEKRGSLKFRPNVRFGVFLARLEAQRLAREILATGRFPRYAALFAYELQRKGNAEQSTLCDSLLGNAPIYEGLWTPSDAARLHAKLEEERRLLLPLAPPLPADWDIVKDLSPLFSSLPRTSWSLGLESGSEPFREFNDGNAPLRAFVAGYLRETLAQELPTLDAYAYRHVRAAEDAGNPRYIRAPFDMEYFKAMDRLGQTLEFRSPGSAHCRSLIETIKKEWL